MFGDEPHDYDPYTATIDPFAGNVSMYQQEGGEEQTIAGFDPNYQQPAYSGRDYSIIPEGMEADVFYAQVQNEPEYALWYQYHYGAVAE